MEMNTKAKGIKANEYKSTGNENKFKEIEYKSKGNNKKIRNWMKN